MNIKNEDGEPGVPPTVALYSILGFWFFYAMLVTLRASVMGFEAQGAKGAERHAGSVFDEVCAKEGGNLRVAFPSAT